MNYLVARFIENNEKYRGREPEVSTNCLNQQRTFHNFYYTFIGSGLQREFYQLVDDGKKFLDACVNYVLHF